MEIPFAATALPFLRAATALPKASTHLMTERAPTIQSSEARHPSPPRARSCLQRSTPHTGPRIFRTASGSPFFYVMQPAASARLQLMPTSSAAKERTVEPYLMMQTALVLFAVSAAGGIVMAVIRFSGRPHPPTWLAMLHGFLSAAALTLLIYAACTVGVPSLALVAVVLFTIAALGGAMMNLAYHWRALALPKWLVLVHGGIAVVAFLCLLYAVWPTFGVHAT